MDNGKEFKNKKFKSFCKKLDVILILGQPRHPQTQGAIERYNRTIKDYLKTCFEECDRKGEIFNLENELNTCLDIYNKTKHSTIGFSPYYVFSSTDKNLFDKIRKNTLKSQIYNKIKNCNIIGNTNGLLA